MASSQRRSPRSSATSDTDESGPAAHASEQADGVMRRVGELIAIGGGEERSPDGAILRRVVAAAGGTRARIIVCAGASREPDEPLRDYERLFAAAGASEVTTEPLRDRDAANAPALVERARRATAVFFTGGDQLKLVTTLGGTAFGECVRTRLQSEGLVVAGTSAGAAAMSSVMVVGGPNEGTVRRSDVDLAPGLGYWRDTVIDTHFNQRGRVSRLLAAFAASPQVLGVGLDEDTAVHVALGRRLRVIGGGAALIVDGRVTHTNAAEARRDEVLALFDSKIHVLPDGYGFDLDGMRPLRPTELDAGHD